MEIKIWKLIINSTVPVSSFFWLISSSIRSIIIHFATVAVYAITRMPRVDPRMQMYARTHTHESFGPAYTGFICDRDGRCRYLWFHGRNQAPKVETRLRVFVYLSLPAAVPLFAGLYSANSLSSLSPTCKLSFDPHLIARSDPLSFFRPARFFVLSPSSASLSPHPYCHDTSHSAHVWFNSASFLVNKERNWL